MKYSVIIPCYNSEKTIDSALGSIYMSACYEKYKSLIEVIVVNDGSTDATSTIIDRYKASYPSLIVINQDNQGVGGARKRGVSEASGEYLIFLDSDDLLHSRIFQMLESLNDIVSDADIVRFSSMNFVDINSTTEDPGEPSYIRIDQRQFVDRVICGEIIDGTVSVTLWGKVYKRELFLIAVKDYGDGILSDYYINMQYYEEVMSSIELDNSLYWYRVNDIGISHSYQKDTVDMLRRVDDYKRLMMERLCLDNENMIKKANAWLIRFVTMVYYNLAREKRAYRKNQYKKYDRILKNAGAYKVLNHIKTDREVRLFRTRIFFIIDMYFWLRWKKSKRY